MVTERTPAITTTTPLHPATTTATPDGTLPEQALRYLGLHPDNPATYALALLARRYELDPILNEVSVIKGKAYVTRDGMLTIAHRSGQFDGMTTDDLHEGDSGWGATVTVWRKDMSHGFSYSAGCGKQEPQARQGFGPEMALARAERRALIRAFNIPSGGSGDCDDNTYANGATEPEPAQIAGQGDGAPPGVAVGGDAPNPPVEPTPDGTHPDPLRPVVERHIVDVDADEFIPAERHIVDVEADEFVVPTREQTDQVKELKVQLPGSVTATHATWRDYISAAVGRTITNTNQLTRGDTTQLIDCMVADLTVAEEEPFT